MPVSATAKRSLESPLPRGGGAEQPDEGIQQRLFPDRFDQDRIDHGQSLFGQRMGAARGGEQQLGFGDLGLVADAAHQRVARKAGIIWSMMTRSNGRP